MSWGVGQRSEVSLTQVLFVRLTSKLHAAVDEPVREASGRSQHVEGEQCQLGRTVGYVELGPVVVISKLALGWWHVGSSTGCLVHVISPCVSHLVDHKAPSLQLARGRTHPRRCMHSSALWHRSKSAMQQQRIQIHGETEVFFSKTRGGDRRRAPNSVARHPFGTLRPLPLLVFSTPNRRFPMHSRPKRHAGEAKKRPGQDSNLQPTDGNRTFESCEGRK